MVSILAVLLVLLIASPAQASFGDLGGLFLFLGVSLLVFLFVLIALIGNVVLLIKGCRNSVWGRLGIVSGALCVVFAGFVYSTSGYGHEPPIGVMLLCFGAGCFNILCGVARR
jgi:hypothetical protein